MKQLIKIKLLPNAKIPKQATEFSGGWDVYATRIEQPTADVIVCYTGLIMQPVNSNVKITLVPRSSLTKTHWVLQNSPGLGDADFTGEYKFIFRAIPTGIDNGKLTYPENPFTLSNAIGQMYVETVIPIEFVEGEIKETRRGRGGYGSTDKQLKAKTI